MELTLTIAIIGCAISVCNFALGRKDKSVKDNGDTGYRQGQIDEKLRNILESIKKIEKHMEVYEKEIDEKIDVALKNHIAIYHKEKGNK